MDFASQPHTSFIPKKPLAQTTPSGYRRKSVSIVTIVAFIVFIGAIALAAGVFLYEKYLERSLVDKKVSLEKARGEFDPALIQELRRLDKRLQHSKDILSRHLALSSFFDLLENKTLQNVQYKSLGLTVGSDGKILIDLKGIARSYASVALQSDAFSNAEGLRDPIFSQLNLDESGNVAFAVSAVLDPGYFTYSRLLTTEGVPATDTAPSETAEIPDTDSSTSSPQDTTQ